MKFAIFVALTLAAMAWADSSYQSYQPDYQNSYQNEYQTNYYDQQAATPYYPQRRQSFFETVSSLFSPANRRQFGLGGGFFGIAIVVVIVVVVIVGVVGLVAALSTGLTSSGRGLDTDEWEVDHSVWMNQLQKDFEDSWSTE
ncbi:uncharacterized protein LOC122375597 [Amphibalanus amphitrite]|nr:uncharacterized protein LOC122372961 [Amphibalanus amphitrite]XP_043211034.1 uncharacterized protein LOC122375597 [Amphibalanus amphitrite]